MFEIELKLAKEAAGKAGDILKKKGKMEIDSEIGKDIKLNSDRMSEKVIVDILKETKYPILSEEMGLLEGNDKEYLWIIDPLDGSANYWKGMSELCCTSIALWKNGRPMLGVINRFFVGELYYGVVGMGAWKNECKITTSDTAYPSKAVLATGFPVYRDYSENGLKGFIRDIQNFKKVRMLGAAAVMGAFVAEGKIDAYMEDEIMLWDIAASSALVLAAGGVAEIKESADYKCICRLFANKELKGNYYADGV